MSTMNSDTIGGKMKELLQKIEEQKHGKENVLLTFGFVRDTCSTSALDVPFEIINYCVVYSFLLINEWYKGGDNWRIDESKYIATKIKTNFSAVLYSTIYANPVISSGKHEWKVKIIEPTIPPNSSSNNVYIGIASKTHCLNTHFFGANGDAAKEKAKNYAYLSYAAKMNHYMGASTKYPSPSSPAYYGKKDIITVHLDLDKKTIGFSKNDTFLGTAFSNVEQESYRLAVTADSKVEYVIKLVD
eukprot:389475_1